MSGETDLIIMIKYLHFKVVIRRGLKAELHLNNAGTLCFMSLIYLPHSRLPNPATASDKGENHEGCAKCVIGFPQYFLGLPFRKEENKICQCSTNLQCVHNL